MDQKSAKNRLLQVMLPDDFERLSPGLEPVPLARSQVLVEPEVEFDHAYFFERGIGSVVTISPEGLEAESGLFGRDGFAPTGIAMGADRAPFRTIVQVPGDGHRIEAGAFGEAIAASANLRNLLLRYAQALSVQTSYTALSNAVHPIEERLARWLLMSHDRADGNEVPLTHEFLSLMLAVRRPSVTTALHVLEGNRFITAERGLITIRDRARLEEFAGDSYGRPEAEYERLIGRPL
jgi:CRP-like cAMP-binding protein